MSHNLWSYSPTHKSYQLAMLQQQGHMTCKGCMVPLGSVPFEQLLVAVGLSVDLGLDLGVDHNSADQMVLVDANFPGLTFLIRVGQA